MDEPEELDAMPPVDFDNMSLDEVLDAYTTTEGSLYGEGLDEKIVVEPKSILKQPRRKNNRENSKGSLHWADEVDEPLATEHEIPHWDRRPNMAMFRFDLMRAPRPPEDEEICCFMNQRTLMGVGLVSLVLLGSIAVVLLFKLLGVI